MPMPETEILAEYADALEAAEVRDSEGHLGRVLRVAGSKLYGQSFRAVMATLLHHPRFFGKSLLPYRIGCLKLLAHTAEHSEQTIERTHPEFVTDKQFSSVMRKLQKNSLHGRIDYVPERFALNPTIGAEQVRTANALFNLLNLKDITGIQRLSANLQYELFFRAGRTMHTGESALERIRAVREKKDDPRMTSHVVQCNAAHGDVAGCILERSPEPLRQIVIVGGGCGATLAGLADPLMHNAPRAPMEIVHIENSAILAEEAARFGQQAVHLWRESGSRWLFQAETGHRAHDKHSLRMTEQEIQETLDAMEPDDGLTLFLCNYVLHHFSSRQKHQLFTALREKRPHSIVLIGDNCRNSSESYRRYFGWTLCATLNTGNEDLDTDLHDQGFVIHPPGNDMLAEYRHLHSLEEDRLFFAATCGRGTETWEKLWQRDATAVRE